ncbi:MAG: DTW domain-containing protein [Bdellovibrionaceae bacterium]|nr:DTW domain-containing protein [Pseudobdellovibrionaceae bacterium]
MNKTDRKRKTKDPCERCFLHRDLCICEFIPRLDLRTRVCLVIHAKELKRTTNTGRLAIEALVNSEMRVRGTGTGRTEALDLSDLLEPRYRPVMFYPADDALELNQDFVDADLRPILLIVPDGNWRQASKVHVRHKELASVPRVKISTPNLAAHHLRVEETEAGMATLEAIAKALAIIEGDVAAAPLKNLFEMKLRRTLQGRGVKLPSL